MNQLQALELIEVEDLQSEEVAKFEVNDLESLTWTFRKIVALNEEINKNKKVADAEHARISEWERQVNKAHEESIEFFKMHVQAYHAKQLEEDPKAKTISTPYGKSKSRKSKEAPEKENEEAILQHVIENGMDDYIKTSLKWSDLKKAVKIVEIAGEKAVVDENGQLVPGMTVKPESISFSLEV